MLNFIPPNDIENIVRNLCNRGLPFNASEEGSCFLNFLGNQQTWNRLEQNIKVCRPIQNATLNDLLNNPQGLATNVMQDYFQGSRTCAPLVWQYIKFARDPNNGCAGSVVWECQRTFNRSCEDASRLIREVFQAQGVLNQIIQGLVNGWNQFELGFMGVVQQVGQGVVQAANAVNQHAIQPIARVGQQVGNAINQHVGQPIARGAQQAWSGIQQTGRAIGRVFGF